MATNFKIRRADWAAGRRGAGIRASGRGDVAANGADGDADAGWRRDGGRFDDKAGNAGAGRGQGFFSGGLAGGRPSCRRRPAYLMNGVPGIRLALE